MREETYQQGPSSRACVLSGDGGNGGLGPLCSWVVPHSFPEALCGRLSAGPWRCKPESALGLDSKTGRYHRVINKVP